jgi:tetratricopeptide (TPR) repeat protein
MSVCLGNTDSLLNVIDKTADPEKKADLLNELADIYTYRNLDSALFFAQEAITISRNGGYQKGEILALINLSEAYRELGQYDKSYEYIIKIGSLAGKITDNNLQARYHLLTGYNYFYLHKYNQALEEFNTSLQLFMKSNNRIGIGDAYRRIGIVMLAKNEDEITKEYYKKAMDIYQKAGYQRGIAAMMNNIGKEYLSNGDLVEAEHYIRQALKMNTEDRNIFWQSKNCIGLADIKQALNQTDSLFYYSQKALDLARKFGNPYWEALTKMQMGDLYQYINNNPDSAIQYYREGFNLSLSIKSFENLADFSGLINDIYFRKGSIDSAYKYQHMHYEYQDSLNQNNSDLQFMEIKFQMERTRNEQEIAIKNLQRSNINLLILTSLILVIFILFLFYTRQKIKIKNTLRQKERLADEIELKNKELTNNVMISQKKNEYISAVIENLINKRSLFKQDSQEVIRSVIRDLQSSIEEKGWEEFEVVFQQVHESFFVKLDKLHPNLTSRERRLSALLRLDLPSKEIAKITNMASRSIDTARYRLGKKLGVDKLGVDLKQYLREL